MIKPEHFSPGYTHQAFSLFRACLWKGSEEANRQERLIGFPLRPVVYLVSKGSEYAEVYPRTVEDVALAAINLVGVAFNERCRRNLAESVVWVGTDLLMIGWQTMIFTIPLFRDVALYWNGYHSLKNLIDPQAQSTKHFADFYLIQAKRNPHLNREQIARLAKANVHYDVLKYLSGAKTNEQAEVVLSGYKKRI